MALWVWGVGGSVLAIYAVGWWLSAPMVWIGRWLFRMALLALLVGLTLPADLIGQLVEWLGQFIPGLGEISDEPGASFGLHFLLFLAVASVLLVFRLDLPVWGLLLALVALATVTEGLQLAIPDRFGDWADVGTNLLGVGLGWVVRAGVDKLGEPRASRSL